MSFRSRANPDQRRRRVILDDLRHEEPAAAAPMRNVKRKRYGDDALTDAQPRVTDFLPSSWRSVALGVTGLFLIDVALLTLAWFQPHWAGQIPDLPLRTIDATQSDNLLQLWLTLQCVLATSVALLIFAVRRRRLDDLRGTYQCWLWVAALGCLLTLLAGTAVEELIACGISHIPGAPVLSPPQMWFWAAISALAGPMLIRILVEMRKLRAAQLLISVAAWLGAASQGISLLPLDLSLAQFIAQALLLSSATLLVGAVLSYGCYVRLDASGAFASRKKKKKRDLVEEGSLETEEEITTARVDAGSSAVPRPNSIGAAINAARVNDLDDRRNGPLSKGNRQPSASRR